MTHAYWNVPSRLTDTIEHCSEGNSFLYEWQEFGFVCLVGYFFVVVICSTFCYSLTSSRNLFEYARDKRKRNEWMKLLTDPEMLFHRFSQGGDICIKGFRDIHWKIQYISGVLCSNQKWFIVLSCINKNQQLTSRREKI